MAAVADRGEQRHLAPPLEDVAHHDRAEAERAEHEPERAQRLERRQVGVLDRLIAAQPLGRIDHDEAGVGEPVFEQRGRPPRCAPGRRRSSTADGLPAADTGGRKPHRRSGSPTGRRCATACATTRSRTGSPAVPGTTRSSPSAAWKTYCSDVASTIAGTAPSSNRRLSRRHGLARSASVASASVAAKVKRPPRATKAGDGAAMRGLSGRYRLRQLLSSPGRTRNRSNVTPASVGARSGESRPYCDAALGGGRVEHQRRHRLRHQRVAAGAGRRVVGRAGVDAAERADGDDDERRERDQRGRQHAAAGTRPGAGQAERDAGRARPGPGDGAVDRRRSQPLSANRPAAIARRRRRRTRRFRRSRRTCRRAAAPPRRAWPARRGPTRPRPRAGQRAARRRAAAVRAQPVASSEPLSSDGTGARPTWRSISRITPIAVTKPARAPAASISGDGCRRSAVVPTAPTHHVRRPSMISAA